MHDPLCGCTALCRVSRGLTVALITRFLFFFLAPDSILEVDSLEADLILDEQSLEDSIQDIPELIWPKKNNPSQALQISNPNSVKVDKDLNYVADISFFNGKKDSNSNDVLDVSRNGTFVRSIQFKNSQNPQFPNSQKKNKVSPWVPGSNIGDLVNLNGNGMKYRIPRMLESQLSPIGEVQNDSKFEDSIVTTRFEDSIVTDALLQMTSFSSNSANVDGISFLIFL